MLFRRLREELVVHTANSERITSPNGGNFVPPRAALPAPLSAQLLEHLEQQRPADADNPFARWLRTRPDAPVPISANERAAGLARFWAEARVSFAYWDQVPALDWDAAFHEYLPRVMAAEDPGAYYRLMNEFAALLKDGHTFVVPPPWVAATEASPRVRLYPVEGEPVVIGGDALPNGSAILSVDGRPSRQLLAEARVPASTEHDRLCRVCAALLDGALGSAVRVEARLPGGHLRTVSLERDGSLPAPPPFERVELGQGRVLVRINTWMDDTSVRQFHAAFPDFDGVRGLILDLRQNRGGNTSHAMAVLARMIDQPVPGLLGRIPMYCAVTDGRALPRPWLTVAEPPVDPDTTRFRYPGPVAVLTSFMTYSASENFCAVFRQSGRGPLVGEPTGGSSGQPALFPLPGGGFGAVCAKLTTYHDETPFVGVGIAPDIGAPPTIAALADGRDLALERALEALRLSS